MAWLYNVLFLAAVLTLAELTQRNLVSKQKSKILRERSIQKPGCHPVSVGVWDIWAVGLTFLPAYPKNERKMKKSINRPNSIDRGGL